MLGSGQSASVMGARGQSSPGSKGEWVLSHACCSPGFFTFFHERHVVLIRRAPESSEVGELSPSLCRGLLAHGGSGFTASLTDICCKHF